MIRRYFRNYASLNVPITALGVVLVGVLFLVTPNSSVFMSDGFHYVFSGIPRVWWGIAFVFAGLVPILRVHWVGVFVLMAVVMVYAVWWLAAWADGSASPTTFLWLAIVAAQLVLAVSRRGIRG